MEKINDYRLHLEAKSIAAELYAEGLQNHDNDKAAAIEYARDMAHESAFNHELAIYTYKALLVCAECNTDDAEQWLEDCGLTFSSLSDHATAVAGAALYCAINEAIIDLENEGEE